MKEEIKNPENVVEYTMYKQWRHIVSVVKKNTANKYSTVRRSRQNRLMLASNYITGDKKKLRLIKNDESSRLPSKLEIRTSLNNIPLIGEILFYGNCFVLIIFETISLK